MHDQRVLDLLAPRAGNLIDKASKLKTERERVDFVFLSILSRMPGDADRADAAACLKKNAGDPVAAMGHLVWALLASTEFCLNH